MFFAVTWLVVAVAAKYLWDKQVLNLFLSSTLKKAFKRMMLLWKHQSLHYAFVVAAQRLQLCICTLAIQYLRWNDGRGRFLSCDSTQTQWARSRGSPWGLRGCRQMVKHSEMTQASPSLNTDDRMVRIPVCSEHACKHGAIRAAQISAMRLLLLLRGTTCKTPN